MSHSYLRSFAATIVVVLLSACLASLLVDPYGIYRIVLVEGFNEVKVRPGRTVPQIKLAAALAHRPNVLILGNSRAEIGFDPQSGYLRNGSWIPFNLAVPGSGVAEVADQLVYLRDKLDVKVIILAIDFVDFLVDPDVMPVPARPSHPNETAQQISTLFNTLVSVQAVSDSLATIRAQSDPTAASMGLDGFNSVQDFAAIALAEGYNTMFEQRARESARRFARLPKAIFLAGTRQSPSWDSLAQVLELAQSKGMVVKVVIHPYHAQLLSMFEGFGFWPLFEAWKARVVEITEMIDRGSTRHMEVWDFSGFSGHQCELIPSNGDRSTVTRWYWEAGHYKKDLGGVMLAKMFGEHLLIGNVVGDFA